MVVANKGRRNPRMGVVGVVCPWMWPAVWTMGVPVCGTAHGQQSRPHGQPTMGDAARSRADRVRRWLQMAQMHTDQRAISPPDLHRPRPSLPLDLAPAPRPDGRPRYRDGFCGVFHQRVHRDSLTSRDAPSSSTGQSQRTQMQPYLTHMMLWTGVWR